MEKTEEIHSLATYGKGEGRQGDKMLRKNYPHISTPPDVLP